MRIQSSADRVHQLRIRLGFTQKVFADLVGVSVQSISVWESGRHRAPAYVHARLDQIDKMSKADALAFLDDNGTRVPPRQRK